MVGIRVVAIFEESSEEKGGGLGGIGLRHVWLDKGETRQQIHSRSAASRSTNAGQSAKSRQKRELAKGGKRTLLRPHTATTLDS